MRIVQVDNKNFIMADEQQVTSQSTPFLTFLKKYRYAFELGLFLTVFAVAMGVFALSVFAAFGPAGLLLVPIYGSILGYVTGLLAVCIGRAASPIQTESQFQKIMGGFVWASPILGAIGMCIGTLIAPGLGTLIGVVGFSPFIIALVASCIYSFVKPDVGGALPQTKQNETIKADHQSDQDECDQPEDSHIYGAMWSAQRTLAVDDDQKTLLLLN